MNNTQQKQISNLVQALLINANAQKKVEAVRDTLQFLSKKSRKNARAHGGDEVLPSRRKKDMGGSL